MHLPEKIRDFFENARKFAKTRAKNAKCEQNPKAKMPTQKHRFGKANTDGRAKCKRCNKEASAKLAESMLFDETCEPVKCECGEVFPAESWHWHGDKIVIMRSGETLAIIEQSESRTKRERLIHEAAEAIHARIRERAMRSPISEAVDTVNMAMLERMSDEQLENVIAGPTFRRADEASITVSLRPRSRTFL
jgi:hypothetical protein